MTTEGRRGLGDRSRWSSGGCIVSGASLKRSLLFTGVRINSFAAVEKRSCCPTVEIGRCARLTNVVDRPRRADPGGARRRRGPREDARRFRRTEKGICLITQPMIDKLGL